jgi:uncharacterized membrane protein YqaE (UPF0057 family)
MPPLRAGCTGRSPADCIGDWACNSPPLAVTLAVGAWSSVIVVVVLHMQAPPPLPPRNEQLSLTGWFRKAPERSGFGSSKLRFFELHGKQVCPFVKSFFSFFLPMLVVGLPHSGSRRAHAAHRTRVLSSARCGTLRGFTKTGPGPDQRERSTSVAVWTSRWRGVRSQSQRGRGTTR